MTIATLRVPTNDFFKIRHIDSEESLKEQGFKEADIPGESALDYVYRTMKVVLKSTCLKDIYNDSEVTYEACKWATLYHFCYLSIWDSSKCNEDFIITDNGMNCEHDKSRFITFYNLGGKGPFKNENDEMLKLGYVDKHIIDLKNCKDETRSIYEEVRYKMQYVYANYYSFAISSKRTIALINPFFRLYYDKNILEKTKHIPDIWPTSLSKEAMSSNTCTYIKKGEYSEKDEYHYPIKDLCLEDVIIINCMSLDRINEWLGFDNSAKVIRSLNTYNLIPYYYRRKYYDELIKKLYENGYDFPNSEKYRNISDKLVYRKFTSTEMMYIEFVFNSISKGL